MADAKRDSNYITTLLAVSNADGSTPVTLYADPTTHRLLTSAAAPASVAAVFMVFESDTSISTGDGRSGFPCGAVLDGMNITAALATVHTKGVTGTTDIQVRRRRAGVNADMLSTKITIGDEFYAADGVIDTSNDDIATGDTLYVDVDAVHSGTAPLGLSVALTFATP